MVAEGKGAEEAGEGEEIKYEIKCCSMSLDLQERVMPFILDFAENKTEKDAATKLKRKLDELDGETWHCIVGGDFGASLCYDAKNLLFVKAGDKHVLLFKSFDLDSTLSTLT